jgi:CheY-like chemotaxis protein
VTALVAQPTKRLRILVVDDDAVARRLVVAALRSRYDIIEARDGVEAVECFQNDRPDVVVMDVEMPRATGSEAAARMRAVAGPRYVPILLVSSLDQISKVVSALSTGADDFLPKPFNPRLFESKLQVFLRIRDMQNNLIEQNRELSRFREETRAEQALAQQVFERLLERGALKDPRVRVLTSALGVLSGDVVAAADLPNGGFRWLLCDVAGHGLSGALGTLPASTIFSSASTRGASLEETIECMNRELKAVLPTSLFCATALLELDRERSTLTLFNAGLPDVLITGSDGVRVVPSHMLPLGIVGGPSLCLCAQSVPVRDGDIIWAMSDGIVEATSPGDEPFGATRVLAALSSQPNLDGALQTLSHQLRAHTGGVQGDDEAIIGVRV